MLNAAKESSIVLCWLLDSFIHGEREAAFEEGIMCLVLWCLCTFCDFPCLEVPVGLVLRLSEFLATDASMLRVEVTAIFFSRSATAGYL